MFAFLTVLSILFNFSISVRFAVPEVRVEALSPRGFRVSIPDEEGISLFAFHGKVNEEMYNREAGDYSVDIVKPKNGRWTYFNKGLRLKPGDVIYYWVNVDYDDGDGVRGYIKDDQSFTVTELTNADTISPATPTPTPTPTATPTPTPPVCKESPTIVNGRKDSCSGAVIFEDVFNGPLVDRTKWTVHHKIPTYSGPNYEFNSYLDKDETRYISDNKLYLRPVTVLREGDVRGVLNLTDKCTSDKLHECVYTQKSSFILPPVKSAKITSKVGFQYGKIEIKAKLPSGDWIVPIMELEDKAQTDGENSAEVWIAYSRGNRVLKGNGPEDYGSRLLFGGPVVFPVEPIRSKHLASKYGPRPYSDDYHVYTLEWRPDRMAFYVDNEIFGDIATNEGFAEYSLDVRADWTQPGAPYNREYVLSLGVSIGGLFDFPDEFNSENDPKPWSNTERNYIYKFFEARDVWRRTWRGDDVALQIDYVRVTAI